jgi:cobalt-zinc-cadmium efflux system outer membrane protein
MALERSPELAAFSAEIRAREWLTVQAGLRPNPELRSELENVGISGGRQGFDETETTLLLSQLIELGGKRSKRQRLAALEGELARWDYEAQRLEVLARVMKAFIGVLVAQGRLELAKKLEQVAREGVDTVARSVEAGASVPVETTRARVTLGRAAIERARAEKELLVARATLVASWGGKEARFTKVAGDLPHLPAIPAESLLLENLPASPDIARWTTEQSERKASLDLEAARRIPDVTAGAGGRHFSDTSDNALVFELSVPLPVFDRNQGAIAASQSRLTRAMREGEAAEINARAAVQEAYQRLSAAAGQAETLRSTVLPEARAASAGTVDAFKKGLLRPLDLLESQRTLFELEGDYLTALGEAHLAAADLERLTAHPLTTHGDTR